MKKQQAKQQRCSHAGTKLLPHGIEAKYPHLPNPARTFIPALIKAWQLSPQRC